ncbi:hypothetical protein [Acetobacter malorum]|nr:hypothetical protein [Acetobacter malorum]
MTRNSKRTSFIIIPENDTLHGIMASFSDDPSELHKLALACALTQSLAESGIDPDLASLIDANIANAYKSADPMAILDYANSIVRQDKSGGMVNFLRAVEENGVSALRQGLLTLVPNTVPLKALATKYGLTLKSHASSDAWVTGLASIHATA